MTLDRSALDALALAAHYLQRVVARGPQEEAELIRAMSVLGRLTHSTATPVTPR